MTIITTNITEAETSFGLVEVIRDEDLALRRTKYHVKVNGVTRHPDCTAEDALRVLSHYLQSEGFKLQKLSASV